MSAYDESYASLFPNSDPEQVFRVSRHENSSGKTAEKRKQFLARIVHETGISADLTGLELLKTHLHLTHIRTLLARCSVVQATIYKLNSKPWAQNSEQQPRFYYLKILKYALEAKHDAKILDSRELQARCDYWIGRAFGGTQDWQIAAQHFALAIESDLSNYPLANGRLGWKGLRPNEKEDVQFLFEDTIRRSEERTTKLSEMTKAIAEVESKQTGRYFGDILQGDETNGPAWLPERDRIVFTANKDLAFRRRLWKGPIDPDAEKILQIEKEVEENVKKEWEQKGVTYMTKRILTEEERCYIRHGTRWKKHRGYTGESICPTCAQHSAAKCRNRTDTSLSSASHISSFKPSPANSANLEHELEQTGWDIQGPAPPRMSRTPSTAQAVRKSPSIKLPFTPSRMQSTPARSTPVKERDNFEPLPRPISIERPVTPPTTMTTSPATIQETPLRERRNATISPILTGDIQKQESEGQEVQATPEAETKSAQHHGTKLRCSLSV